MPPSIKFVSADVAVSLIQSQNKVFLHSAAAAPHALINALVNRHHELEGVELYQIHTEGKAEYAQAQYQKSFKSRSFFIGSNLRSSVNKGDAAYIPVFLSEIPALFRKGVIPLDVAMIQVSPPDEHGYCSLGPSADITVAAIQTSKKIIAQVNSFMPRTHGHRHLHYSEIDFLVEAHEPLPEVPFEAPSVEEQKIGQLIAGLIEDGSTLQMGIGSIPNSTLNCLTNHKNLGIHTEMFSDPIVDLVEKGVVNGKFKKKHPEKIVSSFVMGTKKVYDFIHNNPNVFLLDCAYTNDTSIIRQNPKVVAINSAIEVDLTGQVCADSIGPKLYSGVGGQMDFIRGASLSEGGKPIIALRSLTARGESKIVPMLKEGAGVVTTRAHTQYVVTEFGVANLYGKTLQERAEALIKIAHPSHQEDLIIAWKKRFQ